MNEGFDNIGNMSLETTKNALLGSLDELDVSPAFQKEFLRMDGKKLVGLATLVGLAMALSSCTADASASTPEQKNPEDSNDPESSEQNPVDEEATQEEVVSLPSGDYFVDEGEDRVREDEGDVISYDSSEDSSGEGGLGEDGPGKPELQIPELSEEIAIMYDLLKNSSNVDVEESLKTIQVNGSAYVMTIPVENGVYLNYNEKINFFRIGESRWRIQKTFVLEQNSKQFRVMQVESVNDATTIFLIEEGSSQIEVIPDNYLEESNSIVLENVDSEVVRIGIIESLQNLSALQKQNGTVWIAENLDTVFNTESFNQLNMGDLTEEERASLEESMQKILEMIKSLENSNQNRYFGIQVWIMGDDIMISSNLERLNPETQVEELGDLEKELSGLGGRDDNSIVLTEEEYKEWLAKFLEDPNDISFFIENSSMKELSDLVRLQEVVNAYEADGEMNFQQYILSVKKNIDKTDPLYSILDALSSVKELNDVTLAKLLHDEIGALNIIDITRWPSGTVDGLISEKYQGYLEQYRDGSVPGIGRVGTQEYNGITFFGEIPLRVLNEGDLVFNIQYPLENSDLIIILSKVKQDSNIELLGLTIGDGGKMEFVKINENNADQILGSGHRLVMGMSRDITMEMPILTMYM